MPSDDGISDTRKTLGKVNMNPSCRQIGGVLGVALALTSSVARAASPDDLTLLKQAQATFKSLPKDMGTGEFPITPERVALGRLLFFDPRISLDGTVSCPKCHQPYLYGTDALAKPIGVKDRQNPRNAPSRKLPRQVDSSKLEFPQRVTFPP